MKNIYVSYEKTDTYYLFTDSEGNKMYMPATSVILVDDESGAIAVKNIATRKTVGLVIDGQPVPPKPQYRWVDDGFTCKGFDKWQQMKQQESTDSGATWHDTGVVSATSLIEQDSEDCGYIPPTTGNYLTFRAVEDGTFSFTDSINYSLDSGATWTALAANTQTPTISAGDTVMWKKEGGANGSNFTSTARYEVEGNIMSLIFTDDFEDKTDLSGYNNAFKQLFKGNTHLTSAEKLSLPATTLSDNCYDGMFYGCTNLNKVPQALPATTLAVDCYNEMFRDCSSITALTDNYLPATTLYQSCYSNMFWYCTSLRTVPKDLLPATTLANNCYGGMFYHCSSLTEAPDLPATTTTRLCYNEMFNGCTSLTKTPVLAIQTLNGFQCYYRMFYGCSNIKTITCLATSGMGTTDNRTREWVNGVASSGTFYKAAGASWSTGVNGIPRNWNVEEQQ